MVKGEVGDYSIQKVSGSGRGSDGKYRSGHSWKGDIKVYYTINGRAFTDVQSITGMMTRKGVEKNINKKFINKKYIPIYHNPDNLNEIDYNPGVKKLYFIIPIFMFFFSFFSLFELTGEQLRPGQYRGFNIAKVFDPTNMIFYVYIPIILLTIVNIGFIFLSLIHTRQVNQRHSQ